MKPSTVISEFGSLEQEDCSEFKTQLDCMISIRPARATYKALLKSLKPCTLDKCLCQILEESPSLLCGALTSYLGKARMCSHC